MKSLSEEKRYLYEELMDEFSLNQELTDNEINHLIEDAIIRRSREKGYTLEEKQFLK